MGRKRATKRQLQKLCGILAYASKVVKGARTFSRRIIDLLKNLPDGNPRIKLSDDFLLDLRWWKRWSAIFNGQAYVIRKNLGDRPTIYTDASLKGYGLVWGDDWLSGLFNSIQVPEFECDTCADYHWFNVAVPDCTNINFLELVPIYLGLQLLSPNLKDAHVVCYTANTQVMAMINRGVSVNPLAMSLLREMFWISVRNNIHLTARHVPGVMNIHADYLSRLSDDMALKRFPSTLCCSGGSQEVGRGSISHHRYGLGSQYIEM